MRQLVLIGTWVAATVLAVMVAWGGVQLVASQVVEPIPPAVVDATEVAPTAGPPPASPPPPTPQPETPQQASTPAAELRTYQLEGGTVTISFSAESVSVVQATPRNGFSRDVEPEGSGIKVEFRSDTHRSRLDAWWDGGPQERVREDVRD
jgi:hypothetical protein